ncbi:hypothetical protein [Afipia carboxidovorans]|uniref:hypothetical protein n=1 Tax=Afipia carboxidovorans TaxID=40137 RepID=UPI00308EAAB7|nr:hypothetical protein CRBSH125_21580 [Afipia carboxidovorans]
MTSASAKLHEIAVRYAWNSRQQKFGRGSPKLIARVRLREIERLFAHRWGGQLPDDDAGLDDLELAAHHIAHLDGDAVDHILRWAWEWAPWLWSRSGIDPVAFASRIAANPRRYKADTLAWRLRLTKDVRATLGITTIGAIDCNAEMRAALRRKKKRNKAVAKRRAAGRVRRADYEANSLSKAKPWEEMGMSRAKWYRLGKPMSKGSNQHTSIEVPSISGTRQVGTVRQVRTQQTKYIYTPATDLSHRALPFLEKKGLARDDCFTPAPHQSAADLEAA